MFEWRGVPVSWHGFMIDALGECGEAAAGNLKETHCNIGDVASVALVK